MVSSARNVNWSRIRDSPSDTTLEEGFWSLLDTDLAQTVKHALIDGLSCSSLRLQTRLDDVYG